MVLGESDRRGQQTREPRAASGQFSAARESTSREIEAPPIRTISALLEALEAYRQTRRPMTLQGGKAIGPAHVDRLIEKIGGRKEFIRDRIRAYTGDGDPFLRAVTGQLIQHTSVERGPEARKQAVTFLRRLAPYGAGEIPSEEEEPEKTILRPEQLTEIMAMTSPSLMGTSVTEQLDRPMKLIKRGLIIDPQDELDHGPLIPQAMLDVLRGLQHEESIEPLIEWVYQQLSQESSSDQVVDCIGFLRALAQFTTFLDQDSYVKFYDPTGEEGRIPLLPFKTLYVALSSAREELAELPGYERSAQSLGAVEALVNLNFWQILNGPFKGAAEANAAEALKPEPDTLALTFGDWVTRNGDTTPEEQARLAVIMLEQSGIDDIRPFCQALAVVLGDDNLARMVIKEAVRVGMVLDPKGSLLAEITTETLKALETPWQDAADVDFTEIINPETETLEVYLIPGTFGPFTRGHREMVDKTLAYFDYLEELDPESNLQRIILIMPNPSVHRAPGYEKDTKQPGPVSKRLGSIMLHLADVDRSQVFITTTLQPDPARALDINRSIRHTVSRLNAKIQSDFDSRDEVVGFGLSDFLCIGGDEIIWKRTNEGQKPANQQSKKVRRNECLVVSRWGWLIPLLTSGDQLPSTIQSIILTPGTPMTSSSKTIDDLRDGRSSRVHAAALPYVLKHWGPGRRRRAPSKNPRILSVTRAYTDLMREYRKLVNEE